MATGGGGFGRGGRGAALLKLYEESRRKPGIADEDSSGAQKPPASSSDVAKPRAPMGRGALIASLQQSAQATKLQQEQAQQNEEQVAYPTDSRTSQSSDEPPKPMGRGLAAMKALLNQKAGGRSTLLGRGAVSAPPSAPGASEPQVSPGIPREQGDAPPVKEMSRMSMRDREERPRRPTITKLGKAGKEVNLSANYIYVKCRNTGVHQYHVHFTPVIDNRRIKLRMMAEHKEELQSGYSFDGSILYLPHKLPDKETVFKSTRKTDGAVVTLIVTYVKTVPPEQCTHLYNVVFRRIMHILDMVQVQRYFYNPHTPAIVPAHKLEVWPGYITSVMEQEGGLLMLLDASHKVLRTETVHDIMAKAAIQDPRGFRDELNKTVVGSVVLTRYNNKTYRIDDIVWNKSPRDKFSSKSMGEAISFMEYYKQQHNIDIKHPDQPLLLHQRKPEKGAPPGTKPDPEFLCLIPELCYMSGLTDDLRNNFKVMKDLAVHTRVTPAQRQLAMKKFIRSVNNCPEAKAELATWGLELDNATIDIAGRRLTPETIYMGTNKQKSFSAGHQADWSREATRNELICPVNLLNWGIFYVRKDASKANDFVRTLQAETRNMGIQCQVPFRKELVNERIETLVQELRQSINERVQLVVVINPTNRDDRYAAVKKVCCVEAPVPSQVIVAKTISKPDKLRSIVQKIALQINCKLGGELWAVQMQSKSLMVVGIDSFHERGKRSIGGFVASMNERCTRWYSNVCIQNQGQELVHGLQICFTKALKKFYEENHFLPNKIVIFRDGVGDGQLDVLADHEVKQLQRCFLSFGQEYTPDCATVCVQKRINTRIFAKERDGSMVNPGPGTVVDHTVTRRDRYDYFIVSQHVRQGTVSPTHYIVVNDGIGWQPDNMQSLTYKMTHLYYNWPGTVRVPAPCQYAHKLAYLVGESIHRAPAECLSDRLFFL